MNNYTDCETVLWSPQAAKLIKPSFYICIVAGVSHLLFWIQFIAYPSVRQRSMQWLYAYLVTDLLLLIRFFFFYAYRWSSICVPHLLRLALCYCEAIFDNYLHFLQSYILLALNICRYLEIVHKHDVYSIDRFTIKIVHFFLYALPFFGHIIAIICDWSKLESLPGDTCDLLPVSVTTRLLFLIFSYVIPVIFTAFFLLLSVNYIRNTDGIQIKEIVDIQLSHHRQLAIQSGVFCSLWLILWSPHLLIFPFYYKHSQVGMIAQILHCISITIDPIVIAVLDMRFLQVWKSISDDAKANLRRHRFKRVPVIMYTGPSQESVEHTSDAI